MGLAQEKAGDEGADVHRTLPCAGHSKVIPPGEQPCQVWMSRFSGLGVLSNRSVDCSNRSVYCSWVVRSLWLTKPSPSRTLKCLTGRVVGPGCGESWMCMFNFHLRMPFMEQRAKKKTKNKITKNWDPGRSGTCSRPNREPAPGSPDSHPRALSFTKLHFPGRGQSGEFLLRNNLRELHSGVRFLWVGAFMGERGLFLDGEISLRWHETANLLNAAQLFTCYFFFSF